MMELLAQSNDNTNFYSDMELGPVIGKGSFGVVHLAKMNKTNIAYGVPEEHIDYAVKCVDKSLYGKTDAEAIENEIQILNLCAGISFVAQLHFSFETPCMHVIGLEYCSNGDLYSLMSTEGVSYEEAVFYLAEIAIGLNQLHKRQIVFHDLKPENICFDTNGHVKLIDFGLATLLDDSHFNMKTNRRELITSGGTLDYSAPEIFFREAHSFEADWWSFGVLAYELLTGELPFSIQGSVSDQQKCEYICSDADFHRNDLIQENSTEESFLSMFLEKDQTKRFGYINEDMNQVLNHQFFENLMFEDE